VTCARLVSQLINTSSTHWLTAVNVTCDVTRYYYNHHHHYYGNSYNQVTCDVSRMFADKRKSTSLVSVCNDQGHWTPDVPDCIGN